MPLTRFALLGLLSLSCIAPALAQQTAPPPVAAQAPIPAAPVSAEKAASISRLLELAGTANVSQMAVTQMFAAMQAQLPQVPAEFWAKMRTRFNADDLTASLIPIYSKEYTQEDLNGLIAFYQSPLGRKVVAIQPDIVQASSNVDLTALLIPTYSKEYTQEDLNGLIAFYQSPLGRKVVATQPYIVQASSTVSQKWAKQISQQLLPEMRRIQAAKKPHAQTL